MTGPIESGPAFEFEPFRVAVGSAIVVGVLSVFIPWLVAPTAPLAALAVAGWVSLSLRRGAFSVRNLSGASAIALGVLGGAATAFFDPPLPIAPIRGCLLAAGLVPLYTIDRIRFGPRRPSFSEV